MVPKWWMSCNLIEHPICIETIIFYCQFPGLSPYVLNKALLYSKIILVYTNMQSISFLSKVTKPLNNCIKWIFIDNCIIKTPYKRPTIVIYTRSRLCLHVKVERNASVTQCPVSSVVKCLSKNKGEVGRGDSGSSPAPGSYFFAIFFFVVYGVELTRRFFSLIIC